MVPEHVQSFLFGIRSIRIRPQDSGHAWPPRSVCTDRAVRCILARSDFSHGAGAGNCASWHVVVCFVQNYGDKRDSITIVVKNYETRLAPQEFAGMNFKDEGLGSRAAQGFECFCGT